MPKTLIVGDRMRWSLQLAQAVASRQAREPEGVDVVVLEVADIDDARDGTKIVALKTVDPLPPLSADDIRNSLESIAPLYRPAMPVEEWVGGRTADSLLLQLIEACACEVSVTINQHRTYYMSVEQYLADLAERESPPDVSADDRAEMVKRNTVVELTAYPTTPVGSYSIVHWDLRLALSRMLEAVKGKS